MKTYTVTYERDPDDDAWSVEIEGLPDVHTFGWTLDEAAVNAREAIAVTVDTTESDVVLQEHFAVAGVDVDELTNLRDQARELRDIYLHLRHHTAVHLAGVGVSHRDSARILGVSLQRVQQIITG